MILDSIADGVFTVDLDWNIRTFNAAAERIAGIDRQRAIGRKCFDVLRANVCQGACPLKKTMSTGKENIDLKVNIMNAEGKVIPVGITTAVLKDEKNRVVGGVETFRDLSVIERLRKEITGQYTREDIISKNPGILKILDTLPDIACSDAAVLIEGPSGTGKELIARAIHNLGGRKRGPFTAVNCAAIPETLLESELFGYRKGAFTDAKKNKPGRYAMAEGGTLLLDEIGDVPPAIQVKLLRVLQEGEYEPLGATKPVKTDARIISASNRNLKKLVREGRFREDLYYRLNVVRITLPPLKNRREDLPLLVEHFINVFNLKTGKAISGLSSGAGDILMRYDYPGNVRELENIIEHAFVLCHGGKITVACLPEDIVDAQGKESRECEPAGDYLAHAESRAILQALHHNGGSRVKTARELGINKSTLWRKMKKYGLFENITS
ncbi:MAG: sigma 54-interacting transcriptional regulator [Pseudomonadota bacterium]